MTFFKFTLAVALVAGLAACTNADDESGLGTVPPSSSGASAIDQSSLAYFSTTVGDRVFFDTASSSLDQSAQGTLMLQAQWLQQYPDRSAVIQGHADERGTREYNLALGARRAQAAYEFLVAQGIAPARLTTVSYGKERPAELCSDASCWASNRRSVTVVAGGATS